MATVNVYVSDELKAAMGEHELNWSRLAASAFETAINLERTKAMNIEAASLERLRASREMATDRRQAEGVALGKQWAQETADYDQLERVAGIDDQLLIEEGGSYRTELAAAILEVGKPNWREVGETLSPIFGRADPSFSLVYGFIEGATEVFDML